MYSGGAVIAYTRAIRPKRDVDTMMVRRLRQISSRNAPSCAFRSTSIGPHFDRRRLVRRRSAPRTKRPPASEPCQKKLRAEPTNDVAWYWMSKVVATDELREECLQEALKHNPKNALARAALDEMHDQPLVAPGKWSIGENSALVRARSLQGLEGVGPEWVPVVAGILGMAVEESEVTSGAAFVDDLGADSLDTVELVMRFEEEFSIEIPDEDAEKIQSVRDAIDYIDKHSK